MKRINQLVPGYYHDNNMIETSMGWSISTDKACKITRKHRSTILRWNREGWPKVYLDLVALYAEGKVMPKKWKHCFFNMSDNLEIYNVGEICENEIIGMEYQRQLSRATQRELQKKINQLENMLEEKEIEIDRLNEVIDNNINGAKAANDRKHEELA